VANPKLIRNAYNEVIRLESPVQMFTRVATKDTQIGGIPVAAGTRIAVSYAAANRDERQFPDPDRFDIERKVGTHIGFGLGVHQCPGQALARLESHGILQALAKRVKRFEIIGEPERAIMNITRGLKSLEVRVH
jgi:cytochrome P450